MDHPMIARLSLAILLCLSSIPVSADDNDLTIKFSSLLQRCWLVPNGPPSQVSIELSLDKDGALTGSPQVIKDSADTSDPILVESALKAITRCSPFRALKPLLSKDETPIHFTLVREGRG